MGIQKKKTKLIQSLRLMEREALKDEGKTIENVKI